MRRSSFFPLFLMLMPLGGCNSVKQSLGLTHNPPDEFRVTKRSPLELPPEYTLRPPPKDGVASSPSADSAQSAETARRLLIGGDKEMSAATQPSLTAGESGLLDRAGAERADPAIRARLAREQQAEIEKKKEKSGFFSGLFGGDDTEQDSETLDPIDESEKLKNQQDDMRSSTGN